MRVKSLILVYYFSFLLMLPFITLIEFFFIEQTKEFCCKKCCGEDKSKQLETCNPFQSCANCSICYFSQTTFEPLSVISTKIDLPIVKNNLESTYYSEYFHPPNIV